MNILLHDAVEQGSYQIVQMMVDKDRSLLTKLDDVCIHDL
jgi:hypothetical protein